MSSYLKNNIKTNYKLVSVVKIRNLVNDLTEKEPYISHAIDRIKLELKELEERLSNE